jgi:5-(carboxyamino)imidazole ribonucleotide mutase
MTQRVVIILGSGSDEEFAKPILAVLEKHGVAYDKRVISAHKRVRELLDLLKADEESGDNVVYITIAGRSNALSGVVDSNTKYAVIACPPYSEKFGGVDVYSSLRMPGGVTPLVILEPENAALAAIKILAYGNPLLYEKVQRYQKEMREKNKEDDERLRKSSGIKDEKLVKSSRVR